MWLESFDLTPYTEIFELSSEKLQETNCNLRSLKNDENFCTKAEELINSFLDAIEFQHLKSYREQEDIDINDKKEHEEKKKRKKKTVSIKKSLKMKKLITFTNIRFQKKNLSLRTKAQQMTNFKHLLIRLWKKSNDFRISI